MRRLVFGSPLPVPDGFQQWAKDALQQIEQATAEDMEAVIAEISVTNFTETRTLDAATATLANLRDFIATMVSDIQKQGQKRSYGA